MQELFEKAVIASKLLPSQSNENLLSLYSLYKQATEGDVNVEKPTNFFDFPAIAKYNAWEGLKGISKEVAMQKYIDLVASLGK
ncbi:acyl-CoA-binding protein [Cytophaga aurantiaca]|uniref:acyl-CoA-binding protein n=1 Tax=Cytophaga aurantiaca TaxID=29530 RepID=UPI000360EC10|nr:acyl-CoA-binding protein [Cytophaga aurantiaca]